MLGAHLTEINAEGLSDPVMRRWGVTELPVELPVQPNPAAHTGTHRARGPAPLLLPRAGGC
jgi:hypothetical protein